MIKTSLKGIFLDFYGTVVHEYGQPTMEVIKRVYKCGDGKSPEEVLGYWWSVYQTLLNQAHGDNFQKQRPLAEKAFEETLNHFHGKEDINDLCRQMESYWMSPTIYPDALDFINNPPLPIYLISNCDNIYIEAAVKNLNIKPKAIFTSEDAKATKPNPEIFQYALEHSGLQAEETVHIGDSLKSDVQAAANLDIATIWLNRGKKEVPPSVTSVTSLTEAKELINTALKN